MARSRIPDPLERRHLVERPLEPSRARAIAEAYLERERRIDAVAFLVRAGADERLDALAAEAVEAGDAFLLETMARERRTTPDAETWRALAARAREAGLLEYATSAERHAGAAEKGGE